MGAVVWHVFMSLDGYIARTGDDMRVRLFARETGDPVRLERIYAIRQVRLREA